MQDLKRVLVLGASYGSLLATKLLLAGHCVKLVCLSATANLINREGTRVRLPVKNCAGFVEVDSRRLPGKLSAGVPASVDPAEYDLVVLAMQEPQYQSSDLRGLLAAVATAKVPCLSIMNMPPLPYLARVPGIAAEQCRSCYTDGTVWDVLDPALMTLCSADPQASRVLGEPENVIQVRLPSNFKAARFESESHTGLLRALAADIEAARLAMGDGEFELPVKLKVHESIFVPLSKWPMLMAGNYRCVTEDGVRSIESAVHDDLDASRSMYEWVLDLCRSLGAERADFVPFDKYAAAATSLEAPSSAARALFGGAHEIERVDRLVQSLAAQKGMHLAALDVVVALIDARLQVNRGDR
jgi:hypothetical protein